MRISADVLSSPEVRIVHHVETTHTLETTVSGVHVMRKTKARVHAGHQRCANIAHRDVSRHQHH